MSVGAPPQGPAASASAAMSREGCLGALGYFSLCMALLAIASLVVRPEGTAPLVAQRAVAGVMAVTGLFAVEALWWKRRWMFGATATMFLSFFAMLTVLAEGGQGSRDWHAEPVNLVGWGAFAVGSLVYVHVQARRLSAARKVAAAPRPPTGGMP